MWLSLVCSAVSKTRVCGSLAHSKPSTARLWHSLIDHGRARRLSYRMRPRCQSASVQTLTTLSLASAQVPLYIRSKEEARALKGVGAMVERIMDKYFKLFPGTPAPPPPPAAAAAPGGLQRMPAERSCTGYGSAQVDARMRRTGNKRASDPLEQRGKAKKAKRGACYQPGYKTANFAMLVCLHRGELEGQR